MMHRTPVRKIYRPRAQAGFLLNELLISLGVFAIGMAALAEQSERFAELGKAYELTDGMRQMLADGKTYY